MATYRNIESCKGALLVPVTSFTLKIQLLPINYGHWSTKPSSRLFSLLPPAHSPKLQSSEPYPKGHTIIWKIHKYSLGWFSASLDGFTDLCKSRTHRFHRQHRLSSSGQPSSSSWTSQQCWSFVICQLDSNDNLKMWFNEAAPGIFISWLCLYRCDNDIKTYENITAWNISRYTTALCPLIKFRLVGEVIIFPPKLFFLQRIINTCSI